VPPATAPRPRPASQTQPTTPPVSDATTKDDFDWLYQGKSAPENTTMPEEPAPAPRPAAKPKPALDAEPAPAPRPAKAEKASRQPAPAPAPKTVAAPKPKKKGTVRRVITAIIVLLALWIAYTVATPFINWNNVVEVNDTPVGERPAEQPGTAILLVGSDSRQDMTAEENQQYTGGDQTLGARTDTMMLYYIPEEGKPVLLSLPRDSYVEIPGSGRNKLNAAYAIGNQPLLVQTVEFNTGIRIDGYLEIGLSGFAKLVDAVGGFDIELQAAVQDHDSMLDLPAGCSNLNGQTEVTYPVTCHLEGDQGLAYVRMRYADPRGDLGRVERQREAITKIADKIATPGTVLNPVKWWEVNSAFTHLLKRGTDTGLGTMWTAAMGARKIASGDSLSLTVPISNPNGKVSVGSVVIWDDALSKEMFAEIASGDTSKLDRFA
jgi:LCP family protein required for cell wall assembly